MSLALTAMLPSLVAAQAGSAQASVDRFNLGFESVSRIAPQAPTGWYAGGQGYDVALDTVAPLAGARSLRIRPRGAPPAGAFGVASVSVPAGTPLGKSIRVRGYIRTEGVTSGYAGLWVRADGANNRTLALENMSTRGVTGTAPWAAYEVAIPTDTAARTAYFGVLHPGDGTAWFDSLSVTIDGKPLAELVPPPWTPTASEQAWVRRSAVPLASVDAGADQRPRTARGAPRERTAGVARGGDARHERVLPDEAPAHPVPRHRARVHRLRHRGEHA